MSSATEQQPQTQQSMGQILIGMVKAIDAKIKEQNDKLIAALEDSV